MQGRGLRAHRPGATGGEEIGLGLHGRCAGAGREIQHRRRRPHGVGERHQGAAVKAPSHGRQLLSIRELRDEAVRTRLDEPDAQQLR